MSNHKIPVCLVEDDTYEFVLQDWRELPEEDQAVFLLKHFTVKEWTDIENAAVGYVGKGRKAQLTYKAGTRKRLAYEKGLVGWRNLKKPDGTLIPFNETTKWKLKWKYVNEIANELLGEAQVSEEEQENLE